MSEKSEIPMEAYLLADACEQRDAARAEAARLMEDLRAERDALVVNLKTLADDIRRSLPVELRDKSAVEVAVMLIAERDAARAEAARLREILRHVHHCIKEEGYVDDLDEMPGTVVTVVDAIEIALGSAALAGGKESLANPPDDKPLTYEQKVHQLASGKDKAPSDHCDGTT